MKKIIRILDRVTNWLIVFCFLPLLFYGIYGIWDSQNIYRQADASVYEVYKPDEKQNLTFEELKKINPEVFGWLTVEKTRIDYPLVQSSGNSKYVNTDIKGEFSLSGSIFLDCRNQKNFSDINNILYGHHMQEKTMFGELENFKDQQYFEDHKYAMVYYSGSWHPIEFFAFLCADAYDPVLYNTEWEGEEGQQYLDYIREHAKIFRELNFTSKEHFLSLSTCTSDSSAGRHILVGRIGNCVKGRRGEAEYGI